VTGVGERSSSIPVDVQTRFDQFPATIKGAFVLRGADGNPHAVDLHDCGIERIPSGPRKALPIELRIDVGPGRDLFVPFEAAISDLEPGWYAVRSTIRVDAAATWSFSSRGFAVTWPREQVRRGTVRIGKSISAGDVDVLVESLEMRSDCALVMWRSESEGADLPPEAPASLRLFADGRELEGLPPGSGPPASRSGAASQRRAAFYPVPRGARSATLLLVSGSGPESKPVDVPLG